MSTKDFESLRNVHKGRMDWKIKVHVIREWRGVTTTGIVFKSANYLLLDNKVNFYLLIFITKVYGSF